MKPSLSVLPSVLLGALLVGMPALAANDTGSFGRDVRFLDVSAGPYTLYLYYGRPGGCANSTPNNKCTEFADPKVQNNFTETGVAKISLPAYSANSLLCFSVSPLIGTTFVNNTATPGRARAQVQTDIVIESAVLNNPALIDPYTGLPFQGKITIPRMTRYLESFTLPPFDSAAHESMDSRDCVNGLLSLHILQRTYGLTASQARSVFANAMTVTLNLSGSASFIDFMQVQVGFRLYGD